MRNAKEKAIHKIIDRWFTINVIKNKEISFKFIIHDKTIENQCRWIRSQWFKHIPLQTFVSDYILYAYYAMNVFDASDDEWIKIADMNENSRLDELKLYVRSWIQYEMKRDSMQRNGRIMKINNKEELVVLPVLNFHFFNENDNEEVNIIDFLTSENNIFQNSVNQIYYQNGFRKWFDKNRKSILTKNQDEFITNLNKVNVQEQDNDTIRAIVGINKDKINTKLDTVVERIVSAYNKQLPAIESREKYEIKEHINLLQPIITLVQSEDIENVNRMIFEYITDNFERLQEYLNLTAEEHIALNKKEYSSIIVYRVAEQVEEKLKKYQDRYDKCLKTEVAAVEEYDKFVHKKIKHSTNKMEIYKITNRDGSMEKQQDDPFDKPHATELRTYMLTS